MSTIATAEMKWLATEWKKSYKSAQISGIVGDLLHKLRGGYHISRQDQPKSNYSVTRTDDKLGPSNTASAIDMNLGLADMKLCHGRLVKFWKAKDPRMKYLNAWNGWNGSGGAGRYNAVTFKSEGATSDHKWHIHLEMRRRYCNDMVAMRAVLSMIKGVSYKDYLLSQGSKPVATKPVVKPVTKPVVAPKPTKKPVKVPVVTELKIGSKGEKVKRLQRQMNKVFPSYSKLKVDGDYGKGTAFVMAEFQRRAGLKADGVVGKLTIAKLKTFGISL